MPEEKKPETAASPDAAQLQAAIVAGLSQSLPQALAPLIDRISESQRPAPQQQQTVQTIARPSTAQIAEAMTNGNGAELERLLSLERAANDQDRQREIGAIRAQGGAAIGATAKQLALTSLRYYKDPRFQKEIDAEMNGLPSGTIPTIEHYRIAEQIVTGRHIDEILAEDREVVIRKARETDEALEHASSARLTSGDREPVEPTTMEELFPGWNGDFKRKAKAVGGRSDEEELRKAGFKGGLKEVVAKRKELDAIQEQLGDSFGLDKDWDPKTEQWVN